MVILLFSFFFFFLCKAFLCKVTYPRTRSSYCLCAEIPIDIENTGPFRHKMFFFWSFDELIISFENFLSLLSILLLQPPPSKSNPPFPNRRLIPYPFFPSFPFPLPHKIPKAPSLDDCADGMGGEREKVVIRCEEGKKKKNGKRGSGCGRVFLKNVVGRGEEGMGFPRSWTYSKTEEGFGGW